MASQGRRFTIKAIAMPIYEFKCTDCEHELELLRKLSDPPLTLCPACQQDTLVKKVSAAGFRLKGGGWYETDFKSSGQKNLAGDKSSGEAGKSDGATSCGAAACKADTASPASA